MEITKKATRTRMFSKVGEYKVNTQKSAVFICILTTNNWKLRFKKTTPSSSNIIGNGKIVLATIDE